jgi:hypothetical protein
MDFRLRRVVLLVEEDVLLVSLLDADAQRLDTVPGILHLDRQRSIASDHLEGRAEGDHGPGGEHDLEGGEEEREDDHSQHGEHGHGTGAESRSDPGGDSVLSQADLLNK